MHDVVPAGNRALSETKVARMSRVKPGHTLKTQAVWLQANRLFAVDVGGHPSLHRKFQVLTSGREPDFTA
jgi:hypothetical protein